MIRRANAHDAVRISEITVVGWRMAYQNIIDDKILFKHLNVIKRYHSLLELLKEEHNYYVFEEDEIIKGFFLIGDNSDDLDAVELVALYVEPAFKHIGVGSKLIQYCEDIAKSEHKKNLTLWVLEDNQSARRFYEKHGYRYASERKKLEQLGVFEVRYKKQIH